jgi:RNA-binding protein YhbY
MLDAATSELQHQQDRMRRGRYHVLQQEVAQVRQGLEERMLAELQRRLAHQTLQSAAVSSTSSQRSAHSSISPAASAEEHTDSDNRDVA